jgi:hypothetical protein
MGLYKPIQHKRGANERIKKRVSGKKAARKTAKKATRFDGVLVLSSTAFARFEECMKNPGEPTVANKRGAEMLRKLYGKSR